MPILREVSLADAKSEIVLDMYKNIFGDRDPTVERGTATGSRGDYWTVLANSPATVELVMATIKLMHMEDRTPRILKELGLVRASWNSGSQFTFSQHCKVLRALGLPDEKIDAIRFWQNSEHYSDPVERLVLAYADDISLQNGRVPDERMHALREHLSDEQIVELTHVIALWAMHSIILRALRCEWDDRDDPIREVPGEIDERMGRSLEDS